MFDRRHFLLVSAWLLAAAVLVPVSLAQGKRPLNHGDYDGWRSIVGQRLSNDGKFLVYGLFPQEGVGGVGAGRSPAGSRCSLPVTRLRITTSPSPSCGNSP